MYLCIPCCCDACLKSSALRVGVKTLHNAITKFCALHFFVATTFRSQSIGVAKVVDLPPHHWRLKPIAFQIQGTANAMQCILAFDKCSGLKFPYLMNMAMPHNSIAVHCNGPFINLSSPNTYFHLKHARALFFCTGYKGRRLIYSMRYEMAS